MNERKILRYLDLAFCFVFLPLLAIFIPVEKLYSHHAVFLFTLVAYLLGIYYINRRFNIPALFLGKKYTKGIALVLVLILLTHLLTYFPFHDVEIELTPFQLKMRDELRSQMIWFLFLIVMGFCFSFGLLAELFRQRIIKQEVEAAKNRAELALYKAQINPHFLFNTLNTLYGLAITQSPNMESAFIRFSDILKYMYLNADRDQITVTEEIDYISQYIELQRLRLNDHTTVTFNHSCDNLMAHVPPMIMITFVENAFKYGISSTTDSVIDILLTLKNKVLFFKASNNIPHNQNVGTAEHGVGIENCRRRMELLYTGNFTLDINGLDDNFLVELTINLPNND